MRNAVLAVLAGCLTAACGEGPAEPTGSGSLRLAFPLRGVLNRDFYLHNYVDRDGSAAVGDYTCGMKSYDGHLGTDITLRSFAEMDSGVIVQAAAPGTVAFVQDGLFDRNKSWTGGGLGNRVVLRHGDGFATVYGHLRASSIQVSVGESVDQGSPLGLVGSSGNSDVPHLHFELRQDDLPVDPFAGACGGSISQWESQVAYQDTFLLISSGVTDQVMTLDLVKDPPTPVDTFTTADARVSMWVMLFNVPDGSTSRWRLYEPSGQLYDSYTHTHTAFYSVSWWWFYQSIAGSLADTGTWRIDYYHDDRLLTRRYFALIAGQALVLPGAPTSPVRGVTGAGSMADGIRLKRH